MDVIKVIKRNKNYKILYVNYVEDYGWINVFELIFKLIFVFCNVIKRNRLLFFFFFVVKGSKFVVNVYVILNDCIIYV